VPNFTDLDGIQIPATGLVAPFEWGVAVNNNFNALRPDIGIALRAATQSINDATDTEIIFDTEDEDDNNYIDIAGNPTRLTFPYDGIFLVVVECSFVSNSTGYRLIKLNKNGGGADKQFAITAINGIGTRVGLSIITPKTAADYYEAVIHQTSGGALNIDFAKISVSALRNDG
jgi:hypothetical protein